MPENEFEKQVQEKMDQLQLEPSAAVWTSVEQRIRKDEKKRFAFLWLLVLLLAGGIGTLVWISSGNKHADISSQEIKNNLPAENKIKKTEELSHGINNDSGKLNPSVGGYLPEPPSIAEKEEHTVTGTTPSRAKNIGVVIPGKIAVAKPKDSPANTNIKDTNIESNGKLNTTNPENSHPDTKKVSAKSENHVTVAEKPGNADLPRTGHEVKENTSHPSSSLNVANKKKKTEWGLALSVGRSALVYGYRLFGGQLRADALSSPTASLSNNSRAGSVRPYLSFSAGLYWRQKISAKLDIFGSFNYQYLSTRMVAGTRVDSTRIINNWVSSSLNVNSFYRPSYGGDETEYINKYHFLNLSADLSWKLIESRKFKLFWTNGLSYNRLVGSNMLHFDYNQRIYYKDNRLLNKNQLFFKTAIDIPVSKRLTIGPFASFSLGSALRYSDSARRHYTNYGVQLRIPLNKK